jgi:hypothetical protein
MSFTQGVQFDSGSLALLTGPWTLSQHPLRVHLNKVPTPPTRQATWPPVGGEVTDSLYFPQGISTGQLSGGSDSTGFFMDTGSVSFTFSGSPPQTVYSWWLEYKINPASPVVPVWGGLLPVPFVIPPAGGTLVIDDIRLYCHDCGIFSPPPLLNVRWEDPFVDINGTPCPPHAPQVGSTYSAGQGSFVVGDLTLSSATDVDQDTVFFDPVVSNPTINCTMTNSFTGGPNARQLYFLFHATDVNNCWAVFWAPGSTLAGVARFVAGTPTNLITFVPPGANPLTMNLEVGITGATVTLTADGQLKGSVTDSFNQGVTRMGVEHRNLGAGAPMFLRNLLVRG